MAEHFISLEQAESDILACATYISEEIGSSEARAAAMATLVPHYIARGEVDLAAELSDTVADPFVRDKLLILVAGKCAALDDDDYAFQLADAIEDYGLQEAARERIALEKAAKSDFEKALEIAARLEHPSNAYAGIAVSQARIGEQANAEATIEMIDYPAVKVQALQTIASINLQKSQIEKAVELLEKATETAEQIEYDEEEIRAFTEIANHFLEAGKNTRAVEVFDKAKSIAETLDNVHRDAFLAGIAHGLLRAGSVELADRILDLVADKTQIASCLLGFAQEFWTKGEREEAVEALEESYAMLKSQRDAETRDTRAKLRLFGMIAAEFAKFEKPERAIEIAQENIDEAERHSALSNIARICVSNGKDEIARQALNAIYDEGQSVFALIGMSDAKEKLGERQEALHVLSEADERLENVPQISMRQNARIALAERFIKYGEREKAEDLFREALAEVAEIRGEGTRADTLAALSEAFNKHEISLAETDRQALFRLVQRRDW